MSGVGRMFTQRRTIHDQGISALEMFMTATGRDAIVVFGDVNGSDWTMFRVLNALGADAAVNDGIVIADHDVVNHGGIVVNPRVFIMRHAMFPRPMVGEMSERDKRVKIGAQSKTKTGAYISAMEREPDTGSKNRSGRQGRPAAIIIVVSPTYPSGTPFMTGHPTPAAARMMKPAPVVKRCPSPGII